MSQPPGAREGGGDLVVGGVGAVDDEAVTLPRRAAAQFAQDLRHAEHVADARAAADDDFFFREDGGGEQRQHGVFGGLDAHRAA